MMIYCLL